MLSNSDKIGGRTVASSSNGGLWRIVDDHGVIDLGFEGHAYTWNNIHGGMENIKEWLDRGMANEQWLLQFPEAKIKHLVAIHSDHKPLLLHTNPIIGDLPKPFKFESMWRGHSDIALVIEEAWNRVIPLLSKLKTTILALKEWNKTVFGNVHARIQNLKHVIQELQAQTQDHTTILAEKKSSM